MQESSVFKRKKYEALIAAVDASPNPGRLKFYNGTIPLSPDSPVTSQSLVIDCVLQRPCGFHDSGNKQLVLYPPNRGSGVISGNVYDENGLLVNRRAITLN